MRYKLSDVLSNIALSETSSIRASKYTRGSPLTSASVKHQLLRPEDAAASVGVKVQTLAQWRVIDFGPPYVKLGYNRRSMIRYPEQDLVRWIEEIRTSTRASVQQGDFAPKRYFVKVFTPAQLTQRRALRQAVSAIMPELAPIPHYWPPAPELDAAQEEADAALIPPTPEQRAATRAERKTERERLDRIVRRQMGYDA